MQNRAVMLMSIIYNAADCSVLSATSVLRAADFAVVGYLRLRGGFLGLR